MALLLAKIGEYADYGESRLRSCGTLRFAMKPATSRENQRKALAEPLDKSAPL